MKRIVFLLVLVCLVGVCSDSYARISRHVDSFDDSIRISSYNDIDSNDSLIFRKKFLDNERILYTILVSSNIMDADMAYSEKDVKMKIDEGIVPLKVLDKKIIKFDYSDDLSEVEANISDEVVGRLKSSRKVALRFYHENGLSNTIEVPSHVLSEWKRVIATEK